MAEKRRPPRLTLILPFVLFGIAFIAYSFAWRSGANAVRTELAGFAEREAAAGRSLTYDGVTTSGYPLTLRGTVENVRWHDPARGTFEADSVILAAVPYDPDRIVLSPRGQQTLTLGGETYDVTSEDLRFNLERGFLAVQGSGIVLDGEEQDATIGSLIANNEAVAGASSIAVALRALTIGDEDPVTVPFFDLAGSQDGETLNVAALRLGIGEESDPSPTQLTGEGSLSYDTEGLANGSFELRFKNEGPLIDVLARTGGLDEDAATLAKSLLGLMTEQGTKEIALPAEVRGGRISVGGVPLGDLPARDR
jgi:hypothetical protein